MPSAARKPLISVADYLAGEELAEVRHEYIAGELYAMTGASDRHGLITGNILAALHPLLRGGPCQVFVSDMKLRMQAAGQEVFYYPDLLLCCDPGDREPYYRRAPCLLVEVTSESTARVDRREKLLAYQAIPSLREYLIISQTEPEVQVHRRGEDGGFTLETIRSGAVRLECLGIDLPMAVMYEDVPLPQGHDGVA